MNTNELFQFSETRDGYELDEYLRYDDHVITEVEVPAEHNGKPVVYIGAYAFSDAEYLTRVRLPEGLTHISEFAFSCSGLQTITLPKSLRSVDYQAFEYCAELRRVEFKSEPFFDFDVFCGCDKICAENVLMGFLCSANISRAFTDSDVDFFPPREDSEKYYLKLFRSDVFALAVQNDCFRDLSAAALENLTAFCAEHGFIEPAAYFLELKKRKFGFDGGDKFTL